MNTDEVFAVASAQAGLVERRYMYGLILTPYLGWSLGTLFGAVAGDILPSMLVSALSLAIYGMFIAIVIPQARQEKPMLICMVLALVLSCLFTWVPGLKSISAGLAIVICTVAAAALCAWLFPIEEDEAAE